jgi:hypothetical protein
MKGNKSYGPMKSTTKDNYMKPKPKPKPKTKSKDKK